MNDLVRPIKHRPEFLFYREQEDKIQQIIFNKYGLLYPFSERIHEVDNKVLMDEIFQILITHKEVIEKSEDLQLSIKNARKKLRSEKKSNCNIP